VNKNVVDGVGAAVAPQLAEGERVEIVSVAQVGQVSTAKVMATGLAVAALTAGTLAVYRTPKKRFVVLTNRRLLLLEANQVTGRATGQIALDLPREALTVLSVKTRRVMLVVPTLAVELAVADLEKGLKLVFPTPARADGQIIAESLRR
jgi:hypothetical protein